MAKVLANPQKRVRNGLEKKMPTIKQDPTQERRHKEGKLRDLFTPQKVKNE